METTIKKAAKINQSITLKALIIGFLTLILLIPGINDPGSDPGKDKTEVWKQSKRLTTNGAMPKPFAVRSFPSLIPRRR